MNLSGISAIVTGPVREGEQAKGAAGFRSAKLLQGFAR
jgi:hypothetical protein